MYSSTVHWMYIASAFLRIACPSSPPPTVSFLEAVSRLAYSNPFCPSASSSSGPRWATSFSQAARPFGAVEPTSTRAQPNVERLAARASDDRRRRADALAAGKRADAAGTDALRGRRAVRALRSVPRRNCKTRCEPALAGGSAGEDRILAGIQARVRSLLSHSRAAAAQQLRSGPHLRRLLSDSPRVPPHLRLHRRPVAADGAAAGGRVAIDLHARPAPLSPLALLAHERHLDADLRAHQAPARNWSPARSGSRATFRSTRRSNASPTIFSAHFTAVNLSALSPTLIESELFGHCKGLVHRRHGRSRRLARTMQAARHRVPRRDRRAGSGDSSEAAARRANAHVFARRRNASRDASRARSSPPPIATWPKRCTPAASARTCTIDFAPI